MPALVPPLRYLSASDVLAAMPEIEDRIGLAELTMTALVSGAELPPKIGVHPRPADSFAHAMPAFLRASKGGYTRGYRDADNANRGSGDAAARGAEPRPAADGLGIKWVTGFPTNGAIGLPAIHALVILNDASTGVPIAILDGAPITALRTAAVSAVAIRRFRPPVEARPSRVALVGAGAQGRSHLEMLGHVLPGAAITIHDRQAERAAELAERAAAMPGAGRAATASSAREAIADADVVVTAASFGPLRQVMTNDWLTPDALVVPVDYATYCSAEVARDARLFLVDERAQFEANRAAGAFDGYPDPMATIGEAILRGIERPQGGRVVVTHLGVGLADVVFGRAVLETAVREGLGTILER